MGKCAVLIDGGYFLNRLPAVRPDIDTTDPVAVGRSVWQLVGSHLDQINEDLFAVWNTRSPNANRLLYRTFYYDARPYDRKAHRPVSGSAIDYATTDQARFRERLFDVLRSSRNVAVRLGEVRRDPSRSWIMKSTPQSELLAGRLRLGDLTDDDFVPALRQKGVDMRIGLDIASLTLKRHVNTIVLVSGDADFVPAAKLARREGVRFILDPLWNEISADLNEHIDGLTSGFPRPGSRTRTDRNGR